MSSSIIKTSSRNALGKGLSSLLRDAPVMGSGGTIGPDKHVLYLPISLMHSGKFQPREKFDEDSLKDLAQSIKSNGIIQPIIVRKDSERGGYEIIAGERRWRAAQICEMNEVPVIIRDLNDKSSLEISLIENIQRQDLSVIEEAEGYRNLMEEFLYLQEDVAQIIGKSRSHISNVLRLLSLPNDVKEFIKGGKLSMGHARALINLDDPSEFANKIISESLSVREVERMVQHLKSKSNKIVNNKNHSERGNIEMLERKIRENTGFNVSIKERKKNSGAIRIEFNTLEELQQIIEKLVV